MNSYKYLAKNLGVLALSNFATKILSFFLVPLYTSVLTTEEYGTYDLFTTTIYLLLPIMTLNIHEAVMRFSLDNTYDKEKIIAIANRINIIGFGVLAFLLMINSYFCFFPTLKKYSIVFLMMYVFQVVVGLLISFARGCERIKEISIASVLGSAVFILLNLLFLLYFKWGLMGYFVSSILGNVSQSIYLLASMRKYHIVKWRKNDKNLKKEMIEYSFPLIANTVAWWVTNASDRYVVIWLRGTAENGIYSVAYKIPSIINIIQNIFTQAWTLSAVKEFDSKDSNNFFSNMYNGYNCIMVMCSSFLILTDKIFAYLLYKNEFYLAWKYVPFLVISVVFGALSGYIGGIFSALKKSSILDL